MRLSFIIVLVHTLLSVSLIKVSCGLVHFRSTVWFRMSRPQNSILVMIGADVYGVVMMTAVAASSD